MPLQFTQPIDGSAAFIEDEKGRKVYSPAPSVDPISRMGGAVSGTPVEAVAATATITYDNVTDATAGKKVVVGGLTYTFKAAVAVAYDVLIGANPDATHLNLSRAINKSGGTPGVGADYIATVANPLVTCAQTAGSDLLTLTAIVKGVAGDAYTVTSDETTHVVSDFADESTGVDGTPGDAGDLLFDSSNIYVCLATSTVASAGTWKKASLAAL
jgi:hypothetical protein